MAVLSTFRAKILIIGINPYVLLPTAVLNQVFDQAGKNKGPIPVRGKLNGKPFIQTLVKYSGQWRLYLNDPMRKAGRCEVGDVASVCVSFDPQPRTTPIPPRLKAAFKENKEAKTVFDKLAPHYQKEIKRYINGLKSADSVDRNVTKAIQHLLGQARFVGRNPPKPPTSLRLGKANKPKKRSLEK
jgi:hypothetical protein